MKKEIKIYLEREQIEKLRIKAEALDITGKGWLSVYIRKIAESQIAFLDSNVRAILDMLNLQPKTK